jgi:hypothetical protein
MKKYSMDDVQAIFDDLRSPLTGLIGREAKIATLHAVANEPGVAVDDAVRAWTREVLRSFPL